MGFLRRLLRRLVIWAVIVFVALPAALIGLYLFVPPPLTPLMAIRATEDYGLDKTWVPLDAMAPYLPAAAIAAEDNLFCRHHGFDLAAIWQQWQRYRDGLPARGASGITQQTAKNLFLWPGRDWARKGLEAYLALGLEAAWPKRRILEVYLNVAEFGPGVYGAEAAARHHFAKSAAELTRREAALLASVLPAPLQRSAAAPTRLVARKAEVVSRRIDEIGNLLDCY